MGVVGEMSRHPIEDDPQARIVAGIDQRGEVGGTAEAARGREQTSRLVAPRAVEGMLADRQELDMGEAHVARVGRQFLGQLAIAEPTAAFVRPTPPRSQMHLVDRNGPVEPIDAGRRRSGSRQCVAVDHDRGGLWPQLGRPGDRVRFQRQHVAAGADDLILVLVTRAGARHEDFPEPMAAHAHRVAPSVPQVEIANDTDPSRRRREHGKAHARDAIEHHWVRTELLVEMQMRSLAEQVEVEFGEDRRETIGIVDLNFPLAVAGAHAIAAAAVAETTLE